MAFLCRSVKGLFLMSDLSKMHLRHLPKLMLSTNLRSGHLSLGRKHFYSMHSDVQENILLTAKYCDNCRSNRNYATLTSRFTLRNETYRAYMISLEQECAELTNLQMVGQQLTRELGSKLFILRRVVDTYKEVKEKYEELEELDKMLNDEEMKDLVEGERQTCLDNIHELEVTLVDLVCPEEHIDECDIVLEIESGAGGQEAMLFAEEVYNMYENYAYYKDWQFTRMQNSESEIGMRKVSVSISGQAVFGEMKYEGGIHRVQRIPKTESKGRIHTSTISVAILPQPTEVDIVLDPKDLQITTMRSSGPGGQNVNKTDSAVRIKHLPSGMVAECQTQRSQIQNKKTALMLLRTRLYEKQLKEQASLITSQRKIQVGNKNRSEKIRTYNFPQDRITDHRLGQNFNNMSEFMTGGTGLQKMIGQLQKMAKLENLHEILDDFEETQLKTKKSKK